MTKKNKIKKWIIESVMAEVEAGSETLERLDHVNPDLANAIRKTMARTKPAASPQQSICRDLEASAALCETLDLAAASSKQCWLLAGLLITNNLDADSVLGQRTALTTRRASELIDEMKALATIA